MSSHADARPDRPVAAPVLEFRLDEQVERLRREPAWRSGTRDAITLAKGPVLRVVLTVLRAGAAAAPVSPGEPDWVADRKSSAVSDRLYRYSAAGMPAEEQAR